MNPQSFPSDPCVGPNHGNPRALPMGNRNWARGYCLSITQQIDGAPDHHMVFCSADCMCDWHGAHAAFEQDKSDVEGFEIPGRFTLVWITPQSTLMRAYDAWEGLTTQVGEYQLKVMKLREASEGGWRQPFSEGDLADG